LKVLRILKELFQKFLKRGPGAEPLAAISLSENPPKPLDIFSYIM
jgi:hypothetical protein